MRIDTHGAIVFLAGENAYKLKRAVRFPFMDLSTAAKREAACRAEVAVNRPNAPELYLGVIPLVSREDGRLRLGGDGPAVDWVVHMRRFDETQTLDRVASEQGLPREVLAGVVGAIVASHVRAPRREGAPALASLRLYIRQNAEAFAEATELFPPDAAAALRSAMESEISRHEALLLARGAAGMVRRCHGDLHLRNIVLIEGRPVLFDAVEFDDAIATGDVLYDLAFLLMDLWERRLEPAANGAFNRYLWESDTARQLPGLAALPLFLSLRAAIRAKVSAAALAHLAPERREAAAAEVRRYFALALEFLAPVPVRLVAIGGFSGTGKSTVAAHLAHRIGRAPGAVHLRSDIERKKLFGVPETTRLPPKAYVPQATEDVYARLRDQAELALRSGQSVIIDAVHARPEERHALTALAARLEVPFRPLWLEAPVDILLARVRRRSGDASDATEEVVLRQAAAARGGIDWPRLAASGPVDRVAEAAFAAMADEENTGASGSPGGAGAGHLRPSS